MTQIVEFPKGLQGSGKTTYAKNIVQNDKKYIRINRDMFRHNGFFSICMDRREDLISKLQKNAVFTALSEGYNVIIDDMSNLDITKIVEWRKFLSDFFPHVETKITDFSHINVYECIRRDNLRSGLDRVGPVVIFNTALRFGLIPWKCVPNEPTRKLPGVVFDIDGTLSNPEHRLHYVKNGNRDWNSFFREVHLDTPNEPIVDWIKKVYSEKEHNVIIVSGRPIDKCQDKTVAWLEKYEIPYDFLFMRKPNNYKQDYIIKEEICKYIQRDIHIEFSVDDRPQVIENCWRKNGVKVYPVSFEEGDF